MAYWATGLLLPLAGYLSGSVLPAEMLGRRRGVDFRTLGKNPGTAETFRTFGVWPAFQVYALDVLKVLLPLLLGNWLRLPAWSLLLTAAAAVAGHNWSLYYRFWGGKGLATASGAVLFFMPANFLIALVPALLAWRWTGWVPASGVVGFPILIALAWWQKTEPLYRAATVLLPMIILLRARREVAGSWPFRPLRPTAPR